MVDEAPVEGVGAGGKRDFDLRVHRQISRCRCTGAPPARPVSHNARAWHAKAAETGLTNGRGPAFLRPNQYPPFIPRSPTTESTWKAASWQASNSAAGRSSGTGP